MIIIIHQPSCSWCINSGQRQKFCSSPWMDRWEQTKRTNLQLSSHCPKQEQSSFGRTPSIFIHLQEQKSVFPEVLRSEWAAAADIRQPALLHTFPWPHRQQHSLTRSLSLSYTHTPIGYVLGQIICLISHPHNPTTSKINQAPQKKKKNPLMASEEHGGRNSLRKLL